MKKKILMTAMAVLGTLAIASCGKDNGKGKYNEDTPLIFSTQAVDKVFNPFYASSATDSEVVGMTQIGMLTNDANGQPAYGEDEPVVVLDMAQETQGTFDIDQTTTYYFVLKNDIKFSNGSPLTIRDVLFNLYVYLDPVYTGSSTIYSTDIVGLQEYRTQEASEDEQDNFMDQFSLMAQERIEILIEVTEEITDEGEIYFNSIEEFEAELSTYTSKGERFKNVVNDFNKVEELFREELETDFNNNKDSYGDISFTDKNDSPSNIKFTTDVETFLYAEGFLWYDKEEDRLDSHMGSDASDLAALKQWTMNQAIDYVYKQKLPNDLIEVVSYWNTSTTLREFLVNSSMSDHLASGDKLYKNISGIKFLNKDESVTVNGKTYAAVEYSADGSVKNDTNEVLSITINNIDPKAIWNFSFGVAPMYYYSNEEQIAKFDFEENFGVEFASTEFQTETIKNSDKIALPVGAGAYMVSSATGKTENVSDDEFCDANNIYYVRNENYLMGAPKIKYVRYAITNSNQILNSLYTNTIDYGMPNATPEIVAELDKKASQGIKTEQYSTQGYGYIGVNATHVPSIYVRQTIMHSINTELCSQFYGSNAETIHRAMSKNSDYYPDNATAYYPYIGSEVPEDLSKVNPVYADYIMSIASEIPANRILTDEQQSEFIRMMLEDYAGYTLVKGVYTDDSNTCKYTFTVAGGQDDHPAFSALQLAADLLNSNGFEVTVKTDINALVKLTTGELQVWAAAWSSTIDPDMYQVYHMDSTATSVNNWGYKSIKANIGGKYDTELDILERLSEQIEEGRRHNTLEERYPYYETALDLVMQLAVELPTYQRDDLFAYNVNKIDESSLNQNPTALRGLTSEIWNVRLNLAS